MIASGQMQQGTNIYIFYLNPCLTHWGPVHPSGIFKLWYCSDLESLQVTAGL